MSTGKSFGFRTLRTNGLDSATAKTWLGVGSVLAAAVFACAPPATHVAAFKAEVTDFLTEYNAAFAESDTARIRALYVPGERLVWLEDGAVKYQSVADIFESLAALPPGLRVTTHLSDVDIRALGADAAAVNAEFSTEFAGTDGEGFAFGGALSMVLERNGDGWRVLSGHTSTARASWDSP